MPDPIKNLAKQKKNKRNVQIGSNKSSKGIDVKTCGKPQEKSNSSAPGNNYVIHNNK